MKKNYSHIILLIDRSGSMTSIQKDMEGGLAEFIKKQKLVAGKCTLTAYEFDTEFTKLYSLIDLSEVKNIEIHPRGGTALIDSMVKTIDIAGNELAGLEENERPEKIIFITITDGQENASREFTSEQLKERVTRQENDYKWEFIYLGANQDAFSVAGSIGIKSMKSSNFNATRKGIDTMFLNLSAATTRYRSAPTNYSFAYTKEEQEETAKA